MDRVTRSRLLGCLLAILTALPALAQEVSDVALRDTLQGIYEEIEALAGIEVSVSNQVVTLEGELLSGSAIERAVELARNTEGVVEVNDELTVTADVGTRVTTSIDKVSAGIRALLYQLPMVLLALAVSIGGWFLGGYLAGRDGWYARFLPNRFIADLVGNLIRLFITVGGIFLGLSLLDATRLLGTVLGAAGIVGLAVGFAVKDTVENYIASVLMSLRHPFMARDFVQIGDVQGTVARLTSRATILISADGNHIRIPNATVFKSTIINYTLNPLRRFDIELGIHPDDDMSAAQTLILDTLDSLEGVLTDPAPSALVLALGDFATQLRVQAWVDQREHDMQRVRSEAIRRIKLAFDDAGIRMPYPHYDVRIDSDMVQAAPGAAPSAPATGTPPVTAGSAASSPASPHTSSQSTRPDNEIADAVDAEIAEGDAENLLSARVSRE